eukprot:GFKZ01011960.1.p1 GENE.GFKZ01011960.1~~GFKZ01011960.1.p1  ORF type:complete len:200 (-),score=4.09 GFKZ01011960.1:161-760(-)
MPALRSGSGWLAIGRPGRPGFSQHCQSRFGAFFSSGLLIHVGATSACNISNSPEPRTTVKKRLDLHTVNLISMYKATSSVIVHCVPIQFFPYRHQRRVLFFPILLSLIPDPPFDRMLLPPFDCCNFLVCLVDDPSIDSSSLSSCRRRSVDTFGSCNMSSKAFNTLPPLIRLSISFKSVRIFGSFAIFFDSKHWSAKRLL